jgi:hypothetical protein
MPVRARSLSTTMLTGIIGASFVAPMTASAADLSVKAPLSPAPGLIAPAVDGVNWKFGGLGGSLAHRSLYGAQGAVSIPVGAQYGVQIDGAAGAFDERFFGAIGGHFFWRDPARGMLGFYGSFTHWNEFGGVRVGQVAGEGEAYFGPFTIRALAGVEFGNSASQTTTFTSGITTTTIVDSYDIKTRFFDKINLSYYLNENLKVFVGHRYLGGKNALALGGELAWRVNGPLMASAFIEGRIGENDFEGVWGGLRFYWGQKDKTLIQRHRQDDPIEWVPETLFSIINNGTTLPPVTTCNQSSDADTTIEIAAVICDGQV